MTKTLNHVAVAAATLVVAGCQTWGPTWSEVSDLRYYNTTTLYLRPAIIERIDDQAAFAQMPIKVEPGKHVILVQGPYRQPGGGYLKTMDLPELSPFPLLSISDIETTDLDVAAMEHGYARPPLKDFATRR